MNATNRKLFLVCVGEFLPFDLNRLAKKLQRLQRFARVEVIHAISLPRNDHVTNDLAYFAVIGEILNTIQNELETRKVILGVEDSIIGFTSARISSAADDPEEEYFSYYSSIQTVDKFDERYAVVSTALWKQRYEKESYRNVSQYAVWAILGYWLDRFVEGGLSHAEFRYCVGDLVGDLDSIVYSVRKARLCNSCREKVITTNRTDLIAATRRLLAYVHRPPFDRIVEAVQQSPILSFMLMGVLFSLFTGAIGNAVGSSMIGSGISAAAFIAIFIAVLLKEHFAPGDRLG